ncbi:hypothetical protein H2199_002978 [Coniosporium tulheliwenetii]|uniref:Uncharacterized protein n=1 Tax=Coniosporium tulheliwenetii TaxID=3383036 RepID=A0ACC2ZEM6_9PEZI|nr:hypothetical protein H2199_002978 [Cladosporium sp. JES 115]
MSGTLRLYQDSLIREGSPAMEPSPLTQQTRPAVFKPKVIKLYEQLFEEAVEKPEGFWHELFLLKPDAASLRSVLADLSVDDLLHQQVDPNQLQLRLKAVRAALAMASGAYQTGLVSYFIHRDLFPSLMKLVQESGSSTDIVDPFVLLGLLANYNKFEFQNPYRSRLNDFVNDAAIQKMVLCVGSTCSSIRDKYTAIQDDSPAEWSIGSTLSYFGLGALTPKSRPTTPTPPVEEASKSFAALPGPEAAILLPTYDFANANKLFCFTLVTFSPEPKTESSPISSFLSFTSYLIQHAHRTTRASLYTYLSLSILQILVEDQALAKRVCSDESKTSVRLCRQRQPYLPYVKGERVLASVILDIMIDGINHNLRRRLDVELYRLCIGILLRVISFLTYHWSELWRSLLSFIRFLTTYADDLRSLPGAQQLINDLVNLIALSMSTGESFLPDPASYDDLFYKLVETGDILTKFRDAYDLSKQASASSIETLISVSSHYHALLEDGKGKARSKNLSPKEVNQIIKQGYETLSIQAREGLDQWEKFREADHKVVLKKIARLAVADAKDLLQER